MSKAESVEQEVKVEWDPERYEESMAAIRDWVPKGVEVQLLESQVLIGNPNIRLGQDYPFACSGTLSCQYEINQGLIFLFSGEPYLQAIKEDGLVWPNHVSDLLQWESSLPQLYGFNGIPYTVLLNREGKIIGTGLRGNSLEQKLKEIFSK